MFLCRGCRRYLLSANFSPSTGTRLIGWCHDCTGLDRIARSRDDSSWHTNILKRLRADEQRLNAGAQIPLLLQVIRPFDWPPGRVCLFPELLMFC